MTLDGLLAGAPAREDLVVDGSGRFSSAEVESRTETVAAALRDRGAGPGDRVAFRLPTGVDAVVAYRACWRVGAVAVALHPAAGSHQLSRALEQARPAVTVGGSDFPPVDGVHPVAVDELASEASGTAIGDLAEAVTDDDDAVVMFTSGSTGTPRGVVHTHGSLAYKVVQLTEAHGLTPDDCALVPSPLAHVAGLLHGVLIPGASRMKTVLMSRWNPEEALALIERESVTYMVGPPTLFTTLMDCDGFAPSRTATPRMISCGGAGVTQAAAVAEPDDRVGERMAAFVVAPGGFDLTACRHWFALRGAARFITPERIEVLEELPVLASGKVDRMRLAARLRADSVRSGGARA